MTRYSAAVITVSDSCANGTREDGSGPALAQLLETEFGSVQQTLVVPDERADISAALEQCVEAGARLIVTTGGTGIAERDVTPEATVRFCDKLLPGVAELMRSEGRAQTPTAVLSRGVCGTKGRALVLNLPGSPAGAIASLRVVLPLIPHALDLLDGKTAH